MGRRLPNLLAVVGFCHLQACAVPGLASIGRAQPCGAGAGSMSSPPGRIWTREHGWRFPRPGHAASEYARLVQGASPWPDWMPPVATTLVPGTRFQMAIGGAQRPDQPGAFGTFDDVREVEQVRSGLAVRTEWKPAVDRVVTYEVTRPVPANVGPVGPQVDPQACRLLPGRLSQLQLLVPAGDRMKYLRVIALRRLD